MDTRLDCSELIGKTIESDGLYAGKGFKFNSFENIETIDVMWNHNNPFKETIISILPVYISVDKHAQWYSRDWFETSIELQLYTNKKIYIGTMTVYRDITRINVGHLTYIRDKNKWVKR